MSASHAPELDAIALQLLAALDEYDSDVQAMLGAWQDLELYHRVSQRLDRIRMYSSSISELRVHWVELLIAHAELVHSLWRETGTIAGTGAPERLAELRDHHRDAVLAMRNRCRRVVARGESVRQSASRPT